MQSKMKPFLDEGIRQYVGAKNTVAAFESQMGQLLRAVVDNRRQWSPLSDARPGRPIPGGGSGEEGYWIAIAITGRFRLREQAEIDCGFWWNAPNIAEPIIYAEFYYEPKRVAKFPWNGKRRGINSFVYHDRTVLYLPIPNSLEVKEPLNRLLDGLLKQLR